MSVLESAIDMLVADPILGYCLLAALFLLVVSLTSGAARLDFSALSNTRPALACALCLCAAVALETLGGAQLGVGSQNAGHALGAQDGGGPLPAAGDGSSAAVDSPPLAGAARFPLLLIALAYGPTPGLIVGALFLSIASLTGGVSLHGAQLLLELSLCGWLAIFPSPRVYGWAGPLNAVLAFGLAWATAGLALAQWRFGYLQAGGLLERNPVPWAGVAIAALLLALIRPAHYRRYFPFSRIAPHPEEPPASPPARRRQARAGRRASSSDRGTTVETTDLAG